METQNKKHFKFGMLLVAIGIVYGDIGTSPMYVMKSILEGNGGIGNVDESFMIGSLSLVIWTITLLTTVKHVLIALKADNHGEGGIFALYSLVKKCGKWLLIPTMIGGCTMLADGVLTPAVTVTTAVEGLRSIDFVDKLMGSGQTVVIIITILIISILFFIQHSGTSSIGKVFGPVMMVWFFFLGITGTILACNDLSVVRAFNPIYAIKVLVSPNNKAGFMILGSVFLCTTGAEALYTDMGHVGKQSIYISWPFVKICLILNYMGQCAWILKNQANTALYGINDLNPFYMMLPEALRPVAIILSAAAAIIASQALISGSYTLVHEAASLDLMPHLLVKYPSDTKGQIYIPLLNNVLWVMCVLVVLYFRSGARMENAYGLAITVSMLMMTILFTVYIADLHGNLFGGALFIIVFGALEFVFFISSLGKFTKGGYVAVIISLALYFIMLCWERGTKIETENRVELKLADHIETLRQLKNDPSIPLYSNNLVYLTRVSDKDEIDRDILYSILDKDSKKAEAYWFLSINTTDQPYTRSYNVETYGTDFIYRIKINLGYKVNQKINIYLRQIVNDLLENGDLPEQHKKYSIYGPSNVGTFKFCLINKTVTSYSGLSPLDEFLVSAKYAIRKVCGSKDKWYGLDTSSLVIERVPLVAGYHSAKHKLERE